MAMYQNLKGHLLCFHTMLQGRISISNMAKVSNNEVDISYIPVNKKLSLQTAQIKVFPTVLPTITTI